MRRIASVLVPAVLATLLAGCGPGPVTEMPEGVSVGIRQNRDDYGPRRLEVLVRNDTAAPLDVWEARFDSSAFTEAVVTAEPTTIRAGATTALRLQLPPPDCSGEPDAAVRLAFTQGAVSGTVSLTPDDPFGSVARIHDEDCLAARVADVVDIVPGDAVVVGQENGEAVAHLTLTLTPTGGPGAVSIDGIARTILLRPASGADSWPAGVRLDAASAPVVLDLAIVPNNCNTHTVSEDKRGTFLPVSVGVADGASGIVPIGVSDAVRGALYDYIAAGYCRW
ncbi:MULTISPECIES: hypothetical protein [unclassified Rathayibacter]|uniref:hypothetical protein n=1 Tax=unclassified Rathayibacter TaxID=2609250 RepID=UPI0006F3DC4F|nr:MULTISPECIES: hypothetical protein [unclassified Rathayibacter]KQQ05188.1 hypothetical protein ASF42_00780 [Rathayibacter sp. Leaf294]KQS13051.1 hypothetical protein ASG06_00780 [Rathayibacter sp. Leaf185]